ncbi:NAD-dependent epimerase/dehydratase family protein [Paenarthrobacter ureafaciens]|uniref:polysaccharide biosynthesis C-terminal domain-containing protein n=1 Tax=Paenarthrobacter ureafaciens TaxID=37931 RepID=UPI0009AE7D0C|nr:NAD-dependent epimerase/dehydratase family protein [Paenarthrobacter ureafaciens]GLU61374.1 epimerase [Paenarthrobacter ureafaciens]GLU65680.1 epimerase [Paenarthrobacter ureafaciens]GLU69993.1 epimerase [Paenarthrobacter ureafaciens]GLU74240.1 epimerase [Paenarthrobacter ureafaciens]GLU78445.1 epimerase [Paenarthrobacter ureafaciens]
MTHVAMSGAHGFLGWHTRLALLEQSCQTKPIAVGDGFAENVARQAMSGATRAIHIAGVNRADERDLREANVLFARQFAAALQTATVPPPVVVYANSTQASNGSVYGEAKKRSAEIVSDAAAKIGAEFVDVALPNLFGEHGRPFYNAVTATFCHLLAAGEVPSVENDKELTLLHAQDAADMLIEAVPAGPQLEVRETVSGLLRRLQDIADVYSTGAIPDVGTPFQRDLFNTYRSYTVDSHLPIKLARHADDRGAFFEVLRAHGGSGQTSFSTTVPGISRGDHFHRRKIERFTVLSGSATISLRKVFSDRVFEFKVDGNQPVAVDMPTGWAHNIVNTGDETLFTSFWTNELFDPNEPDTIAEAV